MGECEDRLNDLRDKVRIIAMAEAGIAAKKRRGEPTRKWEIELKRHKAEFTDVAEKLFKREVLFGGCVLTVAEEEGFVSPTDEAEGRI